MHTTFHCFPTRRKNKSPSKFFPNNSTFYNCNFNQTLPFLWRDNFKVALKCKHCGEHLNSAVNTTNRNQTEPGNDFQFDDNSSNTNPNQSEPVNAVSGIGGWLSLFVFGLIITPIKIGYFLFSTYVPIFTTGAWGF